MSEPLTILITQDRQGIWMGDGLDFIVIPLVELDSAIDSLLHLQWVLEQAEPDANR